MLSNKRRRFGFRIKVETSNDYSPKIAEWPHVEMFDWKIFFSFCKGFVFPWPATSPGCRCIRLILVDRKGSRMAELMAVDFLFMFT